MSQTKAMVNKLLTNVSNGLFPTGYIADKILPELMSKQKTGILGEYGFGHLRRSDDLIGGEAMAKRVAALQRKADKFYNIETHALEGVVTPDDYSNVEQPFDAESDETTSLTHLILTNKEFAAVDQMFNASVITQNSSPTNKFDNYSSSDPLAEFQKAQNQILDSVGMSANAAIISKKTFNALKYHPAILDVLGFKYNQIGLLTEADIAKAMDVSELIIADAVYNSSKEGQSDSLAQIWTDNILFYIKPSSAAKYQVSLGYKMKLSGREGREVFKYDINNPPNSTGIIVQDSYQFKIVNDKAGYLLTDVLT
mgnify:CR=1 FL=1